MNCKQERYRWQDIIGIPTCITDCSTLEDFILSVAGGGGSQDLQSVTENGNSTDIGISITGQNTPSFPEEGGIIIYDPDAGALNILNIQSGPSVGTTISLTSDAFSIVNTTYANISSQSSYFNIASSLISSSGSDYTANFNIDVLASSSTSKINTIAGDLLDETFLKSYVIGVRDSGGDVAVSISNSTLGTNAAGLHILNNGNSFLSLRSQSVDPPNILRLYNPVNNPPYLNYSNTISNIGFLIINGTDDISGTTTNIFYKDGRLSGTAAINDNEFVTKEQVNVNTVSMAGLTINNPSEVDATVSGSYASVGTIAYVTITIKILTTSTGTVDDTPIIIENIPLSLDTSAGFVGQGGVYYWGPQEGISGSGQKNSITGKFSFYSQGSPADTKARFNYTDGIANENLLSWGDLDYTFTNGLRYELILNGVIYLNLDE